MKIFVFVLSMSFSLGLYAAAAQDNSDDVVVTINPLFFTSEDALRLAESHGWQRRQVTGRDGARITLELLASMSVDVIRQLSSPVRSEASRFIVLHFDPLLGNPHEEYKLPL
jgi:hypothetical protein